MIELLLLLALSTAQSSFDSAKAHTHVVTSSFEGVWVGRALVDAKNPAQYPLGNQLKVRGPANELWFYYAFTPNDAPMIAQAESVASGMKVKVNYDPVCFYILSMQLLGPVASPTPTPTVREALDIAWPTTEAARSTLWKTKIVAEKWNDCVIYNNKIRCWR